MNQYHPGEGSLALRVITHLTGRPDDTMTRAQIAKAFQVSSIAGIDPQLMDSVRAGLLRRVSTDHGISYGIGPGKLTWNPDLITKAGRKPRRKPMPVDFASFVIEKGIPIPELKPKVSQWRVIMAKLEVGDSFQVPNQARDALAHAATHYRQTVEGWRYAIRKMDENFTRIWRTA